MMNMVCWVCTTKTQFTLQSHCFYLSAWEFSNLQITQRKQRMWMTWLCLLSYKLQMHFAMWEKISSNCNWKLPVLVAIFSCAMSTFSEPLIMKYPPGSNGHSFNSVKSRSVRPLSRQYVDRNMIGILPMNVFWCCVSTGSSSGFSTVFVMSTYKGAEYLQE